MTPSLSLVWKDGGGGGGGGGELERERKDLTCAPSFVYKHTPGRLRVY